MNTSKVRTLLRFRSGLVWLGLVLSVVRDCPRLDHRNEVKVTFFIELSLIALLSLCCYFVHLASVFSSYLLRLFLHAFEFSQVSCVILYFLVVTLWLRLMSFRQQIQRLNFICCIVYTAFPHFDSLSMVFIPFSCLLNNSDCVCFDSNSLCYWCRRILLCAPWRNEPF